MSSHGRVQDGIVDKALEVLEHPAVPIDIRVKEQFQCYWRDYMHVRLSTLVFVAHHCLCKRIDRVSDATTWIRNEAVQYTIQMPVPP